MSVPSSALGSVEERLPLRDGVFAPGRRRLTVGLVLTITLVAFESLAIATVMPTVQEDLGGLALYGWVFSGFFLASLAGIVVTGVLSDRRGPAVPFTAGLVLFAAGTRRRWPRHLDGDAGGGPHRPGLRRRHHPGGRLRGDRARLPGRAAAPRVRRELDGVGAPRHPRPVAGHADRARGVVALGVPRPAPARGDRRDHGHPAAGPTPARGATRRPAAEPGRPDPPGARRPARARRRGGVRGHVGRRRASSASRSPSSACRSASGRSSTSSRPAPSGSSTGSRRSSACGAC